ncbi:MAG TPA: hypothetical protein VGC21_12790 [Telluria sp.]|jgi:hypothetical protein
MGYLNQNGGVDDSGGMSSVGLGGGFVHTPTGTDANGTAPGAALSGPATIVPGAAAGAAAGSALGATLNGSATIVAGAASGGATSGTLTTRIQVYNSGTVRANEFGATLYVWSVSTGGLVLKKTGVSTNDSGIATVVDAALIPGIAYSYDLEFADGGRRLIAKAAT